MKVLVISDALWRTDNGVGNSYSNIFGGIEGLEIANICCSEGHSDNTVSSSCFQISESRLIANLKNRSVAAGVKEDLSAESEGETAKSTGGGLFRIIKRSRLQIFFWLRNLIWKLGRWKSDELKKFIDDFAPDIIFAQLQDKIYLNNLVSFVKEYTNKPLVLYAWDDVYSLKQFYISPLFWIDRAFQRRSIRRLVKKCSLLYTICAEQRDEYAKTLGVKTDLLFKGHTFDGEVKETESDKVIDILYTGNLYSGRYPTVAALCKRIEKINADGLKARLHIYSGTDLTESKIAKLNRGESSHFYGAVSETRVAELQSNADVLLHIEPMSLKGSLLCRLSFSTKLVDYFHNAKCILAVGSKRCASMKYLARFDAALSATNIPDGEASLERLINSPELIKEYSQKAWECGKQNHQKDALQKRFFKTLKEICKSEGSSD